MQIILCITDTVSALCPSAVPFSGCSRIVSTKFKKANDLIFVGGSTFVVAEVV